MHWVLQNNIFSEDGYDRLVGALVRRGSPYSVHRCAFGGLDPEPLAHIKSGSVVVMGTTLLARVASERGWRPGVFLNGNFDQEVQVTRWGGDMLNAGGRFCALRDAARQTRPFFARPALDDKAFPGRVFEWDAFATWRDRVTSLSAEDRRAVSGDVRVLVAEPKEIWSETRLWVVGDRVVAGSVYRRDGKPWVEEVRPSGFLGKNSAVDFMGGKLGFNHDAPKRWIPHETFVVDVAETPNGLKIVEVNCLNAAGFYAADVAAIVDAVERVYGASRSRSAIATGEAS